MRVASPLRVLLPPAGANQAATANVALRAVAGGA
jgi:hypothetical protein